MQMEDYNSSTPEELQNTYNQPKIPKDLKKNLIHNTSRAIKVGQAQPLFGNNKISTSKYTAWNFLFLNLYEQFSKIGNCYFQLLSIMQMVPWFTITNCIPTILGPLIFIMIVTAVKDIYEDLKRHKSDKEENNTLTTLYDKTNNTWNENAQWRDLRVGDIIKIKRNENIPADIMFLYTSDKRKYQSFIETKNLDGETNLKPKFLPEDLKLLSETPENATELFSDGVLYSEAPNAYINSYKGSISIESINNGDKIAINNSNIALRGCVLRNTEFVIGFVIFNGHQTKIMLNSVKARPKKSNLEYQTGRKVILIFILQCVIVLCAGFSYALWWKLKSSDISYMVTEKEMNLFYLVIARSGNWLLIFGNFVPISLMMTLEWTKLIQGAMIGGDKLMISDITESGCVVQSSSQNEELGQVDYIFSDKTGTLTCNEMLFKTIVAGDTYYGEGIGYGQEEYGYNTKVLPKVTNVEFSDPLLWQNLEKKDSTGEILHEMLTCLGLCHDIILDEDGSYNASSPDELAFVNFAKLTGFEFAGTDESNNMLLNVKGSQEKWHLHELFEFTSDRKRMSVIVEDHKGQKYLFCKGADSHIIPRLNKESEYHKHFDFCMEKLNACAEIGLRTLLISSKKVSDSDHDAFKEQYEEARNDLENREERMIALQDKFEQGLDLLGATAIEDKLQAQVPDTIEYIRNAGIKLWVQTGDKKNTAKNIAYSCKLLDKNSMKTLEFTEDGESYAAQEKELDQLIVQLNQYLTKDFKVGFVVTGTQLQTIDSEDYPVLRKKFIETMIKCDVCLCCRVSPKQKAQIVKMVKTNVKDTISLAIGDGANDVNMITEAHIGIGIKGVEGRQAARASDYYFDEFRFLRRLLFVHGRESYRKNSNLILYSFYKNVMIVMAQFWWGITNYFSGQTIYEGMHYQLYNVIYTFLPIIIYAVLDKETSDENQLTLPELYASGPKRELFNSKIFLIWFVKGCAQSALIVIFSQAMIDFDWEQNNGNTFGFWIFGMCVFFGVTLLATIKVAAFSNTWSILNTVGLVGSSSALFVTWALVSSWNGNVLENTFAVSVSSPSFWLVLTSVFGIGISDYAMNKLYSTFTQKDSVQSKLAKDDKKGGKNSKKGYDDVLDENAQQYNSNNLIDDKKVGQSLETPKESIQSNRNAKMNETVTVSVNNGVELSEC